jgi:hypothetical protein
VSRQEQKGKEPRGRYTCLTEEAPVVKQRLPSLKGMVDADLAFALPLELDGVRAF